MIYYTGDLHLGHENVLNFDGRPFADVEEMDRMIIEYWNMRVQEEDHVYLLGDFCYKSAHSPEYYLKQLHGHKHLIAGNHDGVILKSPEARAYFESIDSLLCIADEKRRVILCHYPIASWEGKHRGAIHLYGHIHRTDPECMAFLRKQGAAYNADACLNNYMPCKLEEIITNNERYFEVQEAYTDVREMMRRR